MSVARLVRPLPALWGERIVCRLLARENIRLELDRLGLDAGDLEKVRGFCRLPAGMVIVNGPTGCGKTKLLYSMLLETHRQSGCVLTIEDPVELALEGISQIQIRPGIGLTFARCIRSALRQDPDVIMVAELRDLEMMNLCVQTALTGHLVLTTLHAQTSVGAIRRLIDCGLEPFLINSTVAAVISMRLVRVLCESCRRPAGPADHSLPPEAREVLAGLKDAAFHEPVGCPQCHGTGYRGRTAIFEILTVDEETRRAIREPLESAAVLRTAQAAGMRTMLADGFSKVARGVTSIREVLRVAPLDPCA